MKTQSFILTLLSLTVALLVGSCSQNEKKSVINPIKFQTCTLDRSFDGDSTMPSLTLSLKMEYPISFSDTNILKQIQLSVIQSVTGGTINDSATITPEYEMEKMASNMINDHRQRISEIKKNPQLEDGDCNSSTYYKTSQEVLFNQDGLLTIQTTDSSFYGGSQGIKFLYFNNFDLSTGKDLNYNDLFIEDSEDIIGSFIVQKLMDQFEVTNAKQLDEIGFIDIEHSLPIDKFYLEKSGITFVYNPEDIAISHLGVIKVFLPYEMVSFLMKEDSPIAKYAD